MENCKHHDKPKTERSGFKFCEECHNELNNSAYALKAALSPENMERKLAAAQLGSIKSDKKAEASRQNGKKGGRPKTLKATEARKNKA